MTTETKTAGFYGTDGETYYLAPSGRAWIVASEDDLGTQGPVEIDNIPAEATAVDAMMTPAECLDYCRAIEEASGETLIEEAV